MTPTLRRIGLGLCAAMATCYWSGAHPQPDGPPDASLSAAPIRRLTNVEYDNTVRDLLGDTTRPAQKFPTDVQSGGLVNDARTQTTSAALERKYLDAAQSLAHAADGQLDGWLACSTSETSRDCALRFVKSFGRRAWRRPLSASESAQLMSVYDAAPDATRGLERVIASLLVSPYFIYRPEPGAATTTTNAQLLSFEIATRLSYFLWATGPTDALLDLAQQGKLSTREQVGSAARWMLGDGKAREGLRTIISNWLGLSDVATRAPTAVDPKALTKTLQASMGVETSRFIDWVLWDSDGRLATLLTAPRTFIASNELATLYGVPAPANGGALTELDPTQRSGVLTQPSLLWINSTPAAILRGKFVREQLLCQPLPNPPPDVPPAPVLLEGQTARQNLEAHRRSPACNGCHSQMDPIGFGFESYDSIGQYRTMDRGQPVDASGSLTGTDNDGQFIGVPDLARRLAVSQTVRQCVAKQFFRMALGRFELASDAPSLSSVNDAFASGDLRELVIGITTTDAFLGAGVQ